MAIIGQLKERRKSAGETDVELESFHFAEPHPFFNESFYFNGCDTATGDRIITRISHKGAHGADSYVMLLLDLKEHGPLCLELDDVPSESAAAGQIAVTSHGLRYECLVPMQQWRITYKGLLRRGHRAFGAPVSDDLALLDGHDEANSVYVEIDLVYDNDTDYFWYMRDEEPTTLARNLTEEPWTPAFWKYCLNRSDNHGHYEAWGRLTGTIAVDGSAAAAAGGKRGKGRHSARDETAMAVTEYDFGTFRDHSWDIRRWQAIDHLLILLLELKEPLVLSPGGPEYWYLDLTAVAMPGNITGVQMFTTGFLAARNGPGGGGERLPVAFASDVRDSSVVQPNAHGNRDPGAETHLTLQMGPAPHCQNGSAPPSAHPPAVVRVSCTGPVRRLQYWPDHVQFEVFEDSMDFRVNGIDAVGTRQTGFRVGDFDPSLGGCG
jgi:hypothetical protein